MTFEELKARAEAIDYDDPIRLGPGVTVISPQKMIQTHISIIEASQKRTKRRAFLPYFESLEALVLEIENKRLFLKRDKAGH